MNGGTDMVSKANRHFLGLRIGCTNTTAFVARRGNPEAFPLDFGHSGSAIDILPTAMGFSGPDASAGHEFGAQTLKRQMADPSSVEVGFVQKLQRNQNQKQHGLSPSPAHKWPSYLN